MPTDEQMQDCDGVIGLWGAPSVGKTSLLAAAFVGSKEMRARIDHERSPDLGHIFGDYQRWLTQSHTRATGRNTPDFTLRTVTGRTFKVRDVSGGLTLTESPDVISARLADVNVLLVLLDTTGLNIPDQLASIMGGQLRLPAARIGLVCTKCEERWLMKGDDRWRAERGWWREGVQSVAAGARLDARFEVFEDRVWPVSAFGFDDFGRPSVILDEFGNRVPFNISDERSIGVARPFIWALDQLEQP
jgi:hypothetical protein